MFKYAVKRFIWMLFTLTIITFMCFVLVRMLPPAELPIGDPHTAVIEARREAAGYNKPYLIQFGIYVRDILFEGDWGVSDVLYFGQDVWSIFITKLPATMIVNLYSIILSIPFGIILGIIAAIRKNTWIDHTISTLTMVCISVPSFVYAFLIQYFLSYKLGVLPFLMASGTDFFTWPMFKSMLPAILSLSLSVIASFTRVTRAELTEVLTSEFMLLARTKGLTKMQATVRHAMKNCMIVILPSIFGEFIGIMGGSMIIEKIFAIPGTGGLYLNSINGRDYPIFLMITIFNTVIGLTANIIVDISYGFIDPRVRMGSKK